MRYLGVHISNYHAFEISESTQQLVRNFKRWFYTLFEFTQPSFTSLKTNYEDLRCER
jgi:hypothetical protein